MATIPVGGLATGLDTEAIIQKILQADAQPINLLQTKKVKFQALSTAYTDLNNRLLSLNEHCGSPFPQERICAT